MFSIPNMLDEAGLTAELRHDHERVPVRRYPSLRSRQISQYVAGLALVGFVGLTSCSDDDKSATTTPGAVSTVAPEDVKVGAATVTAGLQKLPTTIAAAIAAIGTADVDAKVAAIEQEWASFEGTVKDTDQDLYLSIEDQLDPLQEQIRSGDTAKANATAEKMAALFEQYLAKYPG
jgi:hypothetical protein